MSTLQRNQPRPRKGARRSPALVIRSRAAQLGDYLRQALRDGRISQPPPGMRRWSQELGVSRRTLDLALREIQAEGWLSVTRNGVRLNAGRASAPAAPGTAPRLVHLLLDAAYRRQINNYLETISMLQTRLQVHGIELRWEICPPARLREIARQPGGRHELLILASLSPLYQRLFAETKKPALVLGEAAPGLSLPFINANQSSAVRHATFTLLQRGVARVTLVHVNAEAAGIQSAIAAFRAAAAGWPRQSVPARLLPTALDRRSLTAMAQRLARRARGREGFIVLAPVPLGIVVTTLLQHGVRVPAQAEVISIFHSSEAVTLCPPPTSYPSPVTAIVKQLAAAAAHFFTHAALPDLRKTIPVEVARGD